MRTKSALRLAVLPVAVFLSLASIPSDRAPSALRIAEARAAVEPKDGYDLASLDIFRRSIVQIKDNYVDPSRINPREMFTSALEAVERQVAEVMVEVGGPACSDQGPRREPGTAATTPPPDCGHANSSLAEGKVRVTVGSASREFEYRDIDTIWQIPLKMREVLKSTPAWRAGIKKGDVITQIDADSTVSMELQEAVDRMRGKQGTRVSIIVQHKGQDPRKLDLVRAIVTYETVVSKLLDNGIGYVRLSGFSGTTTRDMQAAIRAMRQQNGGTLRGLVLDMRGNPGGLLEQAIQVSDAFVEEGTIVTTVGMNGQLREPKLARNDGGEREYPMAVLISSESASASEIVAGALKNLNRALIVGRQSFGKGSVQVLYDFPKKESGDESALKLTIAQYLTPGDVSIQEVGITPDIELVPARILKERIDLFAPPKTFREADYDKHFFNAFARDE